MSKARISGLILALSVIFGMGFVLIISGRQKPALSAFGASAYRSSLRCHWRTFAHLSGDMASVRHSRRDGLNYLVESDKRIRPFLRGEMHRLRGSRGIIARNSCRQTG